MPARITYSSLYLIFFTAAYFLNFNRVAIVLATLHYGVEVFFHASRLFYFADKPQISEFGLVDAL